MPIEPFDPSQADYGKSDTQEQSARQIEQFRNKLAELSASLTVPGITSEKAASLQDELATIEQPAEQPQLQDNLAGIDVSSRAKTILGPYKSFESYAAAQYDRHIRAGKQYLAQGKFYMASGAYGMATVYNPEQPLPYLGKSHALLGAGEYASSAVFLARALRLSPEYAGKAANIEQIVGGKDTLDKRTADIERWVGRTGSAELHLLLAYIYYHTQRLDRAGRNINAAMQKLPDSPALTALKKAIDSASSYGEANQG